MPFLSLSTAARSFSLLITASGGGVATLSAFSGFRFPRLPQHSPTRSFRAKVLRFMAEKGREEEALSNGPVKFSPSVHRMQDVTKSDPTGGWEKCWEDGLTPWDLGRTTPIIEHLVRKGILPKGRALVPGCGSGHDVIALACPERYVIGLDISEVAVRKAEQLSSSSPNANYLAFLKEDFFSWHPSELFDLIFDYTFFCAIEPSMRPAWGEHMRELLKPDGELLTLMFPIDDHIGGPPFKTSVADYEKVLCPLGFQAISIEDNEHAVGPRKGREKLGRWKRTAGSSSL